MIISVDLAYKRAADIGIAVLDRRSPRGPVDCQFVRFPEVELTPMSVARMLEGLAKRLGTKIILIDGPQAWKDPQNGLKHSRVCERQLNTPAKTGLPTLAKPRNYAPFVVFSVAVFDALTEMGWQRLSDVNQPIRQYTVVESFPFAAWRALRLPHLPAKRNAQDRVIRDRFYALQRLFKVEVSQEPNHDQLQALVSGIAGLSLRDNSWSQCTVAGTAPFVVESAWREGFIVNPVVSA
jgi:Protein of unknown function (DUF429)